MFSSILDAQTQAVNAVISRHTLEIHFSTLNDVNDPTKALRLADKTNIKVAQSTIDAANAYVMAQGLNPLIYNSQLINSFGYVSTPWDNEKLIPNTALYNAATLPSVGIDALITSQNDLKTRLASVGNTLAVHTKAVNDASALPDTDPTKAGILAAAKQELAATKSVFDSIMLTKNGIDQSVSNSIFSIPPEPQNTFGSNVRTFIHNVLIQKPGYDPTKNDDEAHVIMRKKVLDAFYTAKTPAEKAAALERLSRTTAAMSIDNPIVHSNVPFDPNGFFTLTNQLNTIDTQILTASNNLATAQAGGNPVTIAAAQLALNTLNIQKTDLVDTLLGFRDSPISSAAYPIGDPTDNMASQITQSINNIFLTPDSADAKVALAPAAITPSSPNQSSQSSQQVAPDGQYFDVKSGQYVDASSIKTSEIQSGRYISARNATPQVIEQASAQLATANYQTEYNNTTNAINSQVASNFATYNSSDAVLYKQITDNQNAINSAPDQATKDKLLLQNQILNDQRTQLHDTYTATAKSLTDQNQTAKVSFDASVAARKDQTDLALNAATLPATDINARAITQDLQQSVNDTSVAEVNFNKSYDLAKQHANDAGVKNPNDPSQWSAADRAAVTANQAKVVTAQQNQSDAATNYFAFANENPNGKQALLDIGQTPADIQAGVTKANELRNKNIPPAQPTEAGFGNTATSTDGTNIRPVNGFEQINGGAPFYMQFPTKQSIIDFNMRNGISPYGNQTIDDIARHAIHFNIFQITPPAPRAELVPGTAGLVRNVIPDASSNTIGSFTIYPSNMDLGMSHNHQYEGAGEDFIGSLLQPIADIANGIDSFLSLAAAAGSSLQTGKEVSIAQKMNRKIDSIDRYKSTEKQRMTTEFALFTKKDFLNDVFKPLMFLTALSYPKRSLSGNFGDAIKQIGNTVNAAANNGNGLSQGLEKLGQLSGIGPQQLGDSANKIEQSIAKFGGIGPFRYYITKNPEYISVRHASGLFFFPLAVIESVTYEFHGPWYNYDGTPIATTGNFGQIINAGINGATTDKTLSQIFHEFQTSSTNFGSNPPGGGKGSLADLASRKKNDPQLLKYKLPFAFPTYATCSISYKNAVPLFRDDYLRLMYGVGTANDAHGVVSVTEEQTATVNDKLPRA